MTETEYLNLPTATRQHVDALMRKKTAMILDGEVTIACYRCCNFLPLDAYPRKKGAPLDIRGTCRKCCGEQKKERLASPNPRIRNIPWLPKPGKPGVKRRQTCGPSSSERAELSRTDMQLAQSYIDWLESGGDVFGRYVINRDTLRKTWKVPFQLIDLVLAHFRKKHMQTHGIPSQ